MLIERRLRRPALIATALAPMLAGWGLPLQAGTDWVLKHLASAPTVDGRADDWPAQGWRRVELSAARPDDPENTTGDMSVELQAGVHGGRIYLLARWSDPRADEDYRPWRWRNGRYTRERRLDDMFAVRFDLAGDFNECMLADADYRVDTWLWSAGRSNPAGHANDLWQVISTRMLVDAAEYEIEGGRVVYIKRGDDTGQPVYRNTRPDRREFAGERLPGVESTEAPGGSVADVRARGVWAEGLWTLELSRVLVTGHDDDRQFRAGEAVLAQVAVFDHSQDDHKSVSKPIRLVFPASAP